MSFSILLTSALDTEIRQILDQAIKNLQMIGTPNRIDDTNDAKVGSPSKDAVLPEPYYAYSR